MLLMRLRSGAMPKPPATNRISWPFISSNGKPRPKGPRMPTMSPHCILCSASVKRPARRTHSSMKPRLEGLDEMEMGASPTPKMVSSTNWPGSWRNASRMRSSIKRNSNSFSVAVNSVMDVMRAGHGRYGLAAMSSWPVMAAGSSWYGDTTTGLKSVLAGTFGPLLLEELQHANGVDVGLARLHAASAAHAQHAVVSC